MINLNEKYHQLAEQAHTANQSHIFQNWTSLTDSQKMQLVQQVESIDFDEIASLAKKHIHSSESHYFRGEIEPVEATPLPKTPEQKRITEKMRHLGEAVLREARVGIMLVAGGQGSRLGFEGPKGVFPITPVMQKSLFQLHAEKILALNKKYQTRLPFYIMTSKANNAATVAFFRKNRYFGLDVSDCFFFEQGMLPALDQNGKMILDAPGHLFMSPNGHGGVLDALSRSGALQNMEARGVQQLFYFQVDNVLTKIGDPVFLGYHLDAGAEMSSKVCAKRDAHEKVGVICKMDGKLGVVEYSDMSEVDKTATTESGALRFNAGSIAIHVIEVAFIRRFASHDFELPWHIAHKKIPFIDENGQSVQPDAPNGYKFEKFIFDALAFVKNSIVMEVDRAEEFSPVKNSEGEDSPQTARKAMTRQFGNWLKQAGFALPENENCKIEISPLFALDMDEFVRKFSGRGQIGTAFYIE